MRKTPFYIYAHPKKGQKIPIVTAIIMQYSIIACFFSIVNTFLEKIFRFFSCVYTNFFVKVNKNEAPLPQKSSVLWVTESENHEKNYAIKIAAEEKNIFS